MVKHARTFTVWGRCKRWARYHYIRLLRQNDEPERVAAGLALGVALGVLPTFGLSIVLAIFLAGFLRVNRVSAIVGTLAGMPWVAPFFWAVSYLVGSLILGSHLHETVQLVKGLKTHSDMWRNLLEQRLILPYIIGNVLVTAAVSASAYLAGLYAVRTYRKAKRLARASRGAGSSPPRHTA